MSDLSTYRWYTCMAWNRPDQRGLKLGPVTVNRYRADGRWWWYVSAFNRTVYDGWVRTLRRHA